MTTRQLVKTQALHTALCDEASPIDQRGFLDSERTAAPDSATRDGPDWRIRLRRIGD